MHCPPDIGESLQAYPNIRAAAAMIGVSPSTLSRREDTTTQRRGERDMVVSPGEVLRLAHIYRKRSLNDVAADLVEHGRKAAPDDAQRVESEIDSYFESHMIMLQQEELLRLASVLLPNDLYEQIKASLNRPAPDLPDMIQGYLPLPES
jgi:hypothetical protein